MSVDLQNPIVLNTKSRRKKRSDSEWEILGGLKDGERFEHKPLKFDGYLHKKRNPPLKGWHKRYFILEDGVLAYYKTPNDRIKGRLHGKIDISLSVLSFNRRKKKIDIDAEEFVCHIRTKDIRWFNEWVENLSKHRLYKQSTIMYGIENAFKDDENQETHENQQLTDSNSTASSDNLKRQRDNSLRQAPNSGKVLAWILENDGFVQYTKDLHQLEIKLSELESDLEKLESPLSALNVTSETPEQKRGSIGKMLSFRSSHHKRERKLVETLNNRASTSSPSFGSPKFTLANDAGKNEKLNVLVDLKLCTDFISKCHEVHSKLKNLSRHFNTERERFRRIIEEQYFLQNLSMLGGDKNSNTPKQTQPDSIGSGEDENGELDEQLTSAENQADVTTPISDMNETIVKSNTHTSLKNTRSKSLSSRSESFFDASDQIGDSHYDLPDGIREDDSSSMSDSSSSDFTDHDFDGGLSEEMGLEDRELDDVYNTGRRFKLPSPMTVHDTGLISLLTKNIGKDLTRISMPVTLNEPLNTLQVMCEGLEYSELLDKASQSVDRYERMVYIAAFAVSAYAASNTRAATKPFNPILGETYECIRLDRGWKFVAEQVSHHPPVSVCYADSENFIFKEDCRFKTKFWGKSLEIHPIGGVSVQLPGFGEEYNWKKVTTCVHNVLGGTRWVDQYGDMIITCKDIQCKLTFIKASYWSDKKHEIQGTVTGPDGTVVHYLFGKWTEAFYCKNDDANRCIWRAGNLPDDHQLYYGFTRFAIELNELRDEEKPFLPRSDTRFRPDQRLLELGNISEADEEKHRVEKLQREARKKREADGTEHSPLWFKKSVIDSLETYTFTDEYWKCRRDPGFDKLSNIPILW